MKEKDELAVVHNIAIENIKQNLNRKIEEVDLKMNLEQDQAKIKKQQESQRLVVEQNNTTEAALEHRLEDAKITKDAQNEIELALMELEKKNMDAEMLRYETLQLAKKSYHGKYIASTNITNMPQDDPTNAVLAGVLQKLDVTKKAIG